MADINASDGLTTPSPKVSVLPQPEPPNDSQSTPQLSILPKPTDKEITAVELDTTESLSKEGNSVPTILKESDSKPPLKVIKLKLFPKVTETVKTSTETASSENAPKNKTPEKNNMQSTILTVVTNTETQSKTQIEMEVSVENAEITTEIDTSEQNDKELKTRGSRELKSLMNSAKESKIISESTQITSKMRKSRKNLLDISVPAISVSKEADKIDGVRRSSDISLNSNSSDISEKAAQKRQMRSQNPEFAKHKKSLNTVASRKKDGIQSVSESDDDDESSSSKDTSISRKAKLLVRARPPITDPLDTSSKIRIDPYCWRCHWPTEPAVGEKTPSQPPASCSVCPRSYHSKCLAGGERTRSLAEENWVCPDCMIIVNAENSDTRSPAMKKISLGALCDLFKYALKRMMEINGVEPFLSTVDRTLFPDYDKYVVRPMDLGLMKQNINAGLYGSTEAFMADAQWILHNSIIFNTLQSRLTSVARALLRSCRTEMGEIEACPECYSAAHARRATWFTDVCSTPHILLWAKLKGFPYWPAKGMSVNAAMVDVRFFGAHDRAWVPARDCYLYCERDPNNFRTKRQDILDSVLEAEQHIRNIARKFGSFVHAVYKTPFDATKQVEQLKTMIPGFEGEITIRTTQKPTLMTTSSPMVKGKRSRLSSKSSKDSLNESFCSDEEEPLARRKMADGAEIARLDEDDMDKSREVSVEIDKVALSKTEDRSLKRRRSELQEAVVTIITKKARKSTDGQASDLIQINEEKTKKLNHIEKLNLKETVEKKDERENKSADKKQNDGPGPSTFTTKLDSPKSEEPTKSAPNKPTNVETSKASDTLKQKDAINKNNEKVVAGKIETAEPKNDLTETKNKLSEKSDEDNEKFGVYLHLPPVPTVAAAASDKQKDKSINKNVTEDKQKDLIKKHRENSVDKKEQKGKKSIKPRDESVGENKTMSPKPIETSTPNSNKDKLRTKSENPKSVEKQKNKTQEPEKLKHKAINSKEQKNALKIAELKKVPSKTTGKEQDQVTDKTASPESITKVYTFSDSQKKDSAPHVELLPTISNVRSLSNTQSTTKTSVANTQSNIFKPTETTGNTTMKDVMAKLRKLRDENEHPSPRPRVTVKNFAKSDTPNAQKEIEIEIKSEPMDVDDPERTAEKIDMLSSVQLQPVIQEVNRLPELTRQPENPLPELTAILPMRDVRINRITSIRAAKEASREQQKDVPSRARKTFPQPRKTPNEEGLNRSELNGKNSMVYIPIQPAPSGPVRLAPFQKVSKVTHTPSTSKQGVATTASSNVVTSTTSVTTVVPTPASVQRLTSSTNTTTTTPPGATSTSVATASQVMATVTQGLATVTQGMATVTSAMGSVGPGIRMATSLAGGVQSIPMLSTLNGQWTFSLQPMVTIGNDSNEIPLVNGISDKISPENRSDQTNSQVPPALAPIVSPPRDLPVLQARPLNPLDPNVSLGEVNAPSSAGPLTALLNQNAAKLMDYFKHLLVETLQVAEDPASNTAALKLELERATWRHRQEIDELKHSTNLAMAEMRVTLDKEKTRALNESRRTHEQEIATAVNYAKTRQWCANCRQEAQFYCCWNTSYCDYPCQRSHWAQHYSHCTQQRNPQNPDEGSGSGSERLQDPEGSVRPALPRVYQQARPNSANTLGNPSLKFMGAPPRFSAPSLLLNKQLGPAEDTIAPKITPGGYLIVGSTSTSGKPTITLPSDSH